MKKLLLILTLLLLVGGGAGLVLPSFIDWNPYRDEIAARIEAATGRPVAIDGGLSLRVLPAPTLSVEGVRLANIEGASTRDMARIGALDVAVDLAPLLQGEVRVRSVRVVDPVVLLERLPDGRANWAFQARRLRGDGRSVSGPLPGTDPPPPSAADGDGIGLTVRLDDVRIENGLVVYRDRARATELRIEAIETTLSADSLRGPFRVRGDVRIRDVAVALDVAVGAVGAGRPTQLDANLLLAETGDTLALSGALTGPVGDPAFSGRLNGTAGRLSATLAMLLGREGGPLLARPAAISGQVAATVTDVTVSDLRLGLGEAEVRGTVTAAYGAGAPLDVAATLRVRALDLDAWLAGRAPSPSTDDAAAEEDEDVEPLAEDYTLPTGLRAALDLSAEALTWRGEVVRRVAVAARLEDGRLTVETARAALPGASQVTVSGAVDMREGLPRISGTAQARSGNLREVLTWLRLPVGSIPPDRLRTFSLAARLDGTPDSLSIRDIDLTLDTTRATGAVVMRPGSRLGLGLNVSVDSVNLDAYLPGDDRLGGGAPDGDATVPAGGLPAWLDAVDANFRIAVGLLTADALPFRDVRAEGSLVRGRLALKQARVGEVAGLRVTARGDLSRVEGLPRADHLTITAEADDLARTARLLRIALPARAYAPLQALGTVTQTVTLSGTPDVLDITTAARFQDGGLDSTGRLTDLLGPAPAYDLAVDLRHPDAERLVRVLAPDYVPRGAPLGGIALATQVRGDAGEIVLEGLGLRLGDIQMTGQARVMLEGDRPHLSVDVSTTALPLEAFLPMVREARQRSGPPRLMIPAAVARPAAWSATAVDLSALTLLDADVTLRATALGFGPHTLEDAKITARLADGTLRIDRLTGLLYGGQTESTATVVAGAPARGDLTLAVTGFSVARLLDGDADGRAAGTGTLELDLGGAGARADDLVADLTGTARLTLRGLDVSAAQVRGTAFAGLLEPVAALNDLTGSLVGGLERAQRLVDVDGWFVINDGLVGFDPLRLASALYEADIAGTVDLRAWTIDAEGVAELAQGPLRQALGRVIRLPERIPVALSGDLEAPTVTLRTASLPAAPPQAPAAPDTPDTPDTAVDDLLRGLEQ